jgi:HAAS
VISGYLEKLSVALSFDRALAQRVRQEVEDHLQQAIAKDPSNGGIAAEQRAIAELGDPQALAAQFAMISVAEQTRKLGIALILVIAGIFVAMKGRVAWYAVTSGDLGHDMTPLAKIVGSMDRYSFWLSVIIGSGSFAYGVGRPIPTLVDARYRKHLRCVLLSCLAAIAPLVLSVISDGVLTAIRLVEVGLGAWSLVPIATMAIEIACLGIVGFHLRRLHIVSVASLHAP